MLLNNCLSWQATWHKGHSLAQTVFSCAYLLRPERTLSHALLDSYCKVIRATCKAVTSIVSDARTHEVKYFNSSFNSVYFCIINQWFICFFFIVHYCYLNIKLCVHWNGKRRCMLGFLFIYLLLLFLALIFIKAWFTNFFLWQEEDLFTMAYGLPLNVEGDEKCLSLLNAVEENISRQLRACKALPSKRKLLEGIILITHSLWTEAVRIEGACPLNYFEIRFWKSWSHLLV